MNSQDVAIPQLPSRSIEKTLAFYAKLGFEGELFPGYDYAIVVRGSLDLHFFLHETLENKPWGMREFAVIDEDGTLIRVGQEL